MSPSLDRYLEQISVSAESIATLPFPPPKIFTNALLHASNITSLIRDTEPHERALFSVSSPPNSDKTTNSNSISASRRQTIFDVAYGDATIIRQGIRAPRRNTAVAAVLGPELHREMKKTEGKLSGEVDIEVLLRGVEKLNAVYSISGVVKRVQDLRNRYSRISWALPHYEDKVKKQVAELEKLNQGSQDGEVDNKLNLGDETAWHLAQLPGSNMVITDDEILKEENEIRELESRKRELEKSIREMEKDLGGLQRQ